MNHPYEFSPAHRSLYFRIAQALKLLSTWAWVAVCGLWLSLVGYQLLYFIRHNWTKANRKPAWQWFSERLTENQDTLRNLFLYTLAAIVAIYLLAACHKFLKYVRGALIDACGDILIAGGLIFFTWQYQQGTLALGRFAIMTIASVLTVTLVFGILQGMRCGPGKTMAEQLVAQARPYSEANDLNQARPLLEKALRNAPYHVEALYLLGQVCQREKQTRQAQLLYDLAYQQAQLQILANPAMQTLLQTIRQQSQSIKQDEISRQ